MIRVVTAVAAAVLFVVPPLTAASPAVLVGGAVGLLLASAGIVTLWRWPITAAACVFVTDYAGALWLAGRAVSVVGAAGVGLALLLMLHSAELARGARRAAIEGALVRSQVVGWGGFVAATLGAAVLLMALASAVAATVPLAAAAILAAAGALGVVLALAALADFAYVRSAERRGRTAR
jgi:hypothetical protein